MRTDEASRSLRRETQLNVSDLIWPLFVHDHPTPDSQEISSMPGIYRDSPSALLKRLDDAREFGLSTIAIFPCIEPSLKTPDGREALNKNGLVARTIKEIKKNFPELSVITDVALDPYTSHGHDGVMDSDGRIVNDATVEILKQQALIYAEAGADILAPSDMMDGRVGAIRDALESVGSHDTKILAYAAKYASAFYGPFRDAVGSKSTLGHKGKETYQMDPANWREAIWEAQLDIAEGADMVMVKPGIAYLDIVCRLKDALHFPLIAYQVSGEYSMIKAAAQNGWIDEARVMMETLLAFKRAGCDAVISYFALDAAKSIRAQNSFRPS